MNYKSTRGSAAVTASAAIVKGLAPDGGLYVPESFPAMPKAETLIPLSYKERAGVILSAFLKYFTKEEVEAVLVKLAETNEFGTILRAKGMVDGVDGHWIYFDLVPGEYELREGQADYTGKLCVIGTDLKEEALAEAFHC